MAKASLGRNAARTGAVLASAALIGALAAVYWSGIGHTEAKPVPHKTVYQVPKPLVAAEATWEKIRPRLEQADRDSAAAVETQLARINDFFAERRQGARPFAQAVLGIEGKLKAAGSIADGIADEVGKLLGDAPGSGPDSFTVYVHQCFRQHVLDERQLRKEISSVFAGYLGELQGLEGKLLVDLGADLDFSSSLPEIQLGSDTSLPSHNIVSDALYVAGDDFVASIFKFAASWVLGNAVSDQLTSKDATTLQKLGTNIIASAEVDRAIDGVAGMAGYDPEGALAAKVTASLERMRALLVEGDATAVAHYSKLRAYADVPDEVTHDICLSAANMMESRAKLGLRRRLLAIHTERSRWREKAVRKLVFGHFAPPAPIVVLDIINLLDRPSREQIIEFVQQCSALYGSRKP